MAEMAVLIPLFNSCVSGRNHHLHLAHLNPLPLLSICPLLPPPNRHQAASIDPASPPRSAAVDLGYQPTPASPYPLATSNLFISSWSIFLTRLGFLFVLRLMRASSTSPGRRLPQLRRRIGGVPEHLVAVCFAIGTASETVHTHVLKCGWTAPLASPRVLPDQVCRFITAGSL